MANKPIYFNKTRLAPTPSGFLHVGNVLSFVITATLAQKHHAKILLRIDDLDRARFAPEYLSDVFDTLRFLEIPWDVGPANPDDFEAAFSQVHRMPLYNAALDRLKNQNAIFACTCSRKQLAEAGTCSCIEKSIPLDTPGASWRLLTDDAVLSVKTYAGEIIKTSLPAEMQNFIIRKKDGFPAYQLTSLIDDLFYGVDFIVRGADLWHSTLAQLALAKTLNEKAFEQVTFYHHPLLLEPSGQKLSKSAGSASVRFMKVEGKSNTAVFEQIAALIGLSGTIKNRRQLGQLLLSQQPGY
ncbi:glutamate--tRNA ligase family protein [Mucilaginibacter celer]|uniref:tRNA glutamyl-Q synthetase n=1 Tax=Mucilaginibacter celer TaxID=2305508 RepID=A0A494W300_9SPHI|nr:glutamate--tRNA ligase family protein [Mucilaginibacter celer]AYL97918.1 tRNA glutamyl-Q synthetase [Mucilaginibacter celer]